MTSDITVYLLSGVYQLTAPITFGTADSGIGSYYVYYTAADTSAGAAPVIISGGAKLTGWSLDDATKRIFRVPFSGDTRQLYVNGIRAPRAQDKADFSTETAITKGVGGWVTASSTMQHWGNANNPLGKDHIELVSRDLYRESRCPVRAVQASAVRHIVETSNGARFVPSSGSGDWLTSPQGATDLGDFNGDGATDLLFEYLDENGRTHNDVAISVDGRDGINAITYTNADPLSNNHVGLMPDGTTPIIPTLPSAAKLPEFWADSYQNIDWAPMNFGAGVTSLPHYIGDFDGDGKSDILLSWSGPSGSDLQYNYVYLANNGGFVATALNWTIDGNGAKYYIGNFDGDTGGLAPGRGRDDVLMSWVDTAGVQHNNVHTSTGTSFTKTKDWTSEGLGKDYYVGDFTGDGATDLLLSWYDSTLGRQNNYVYKSNKTPRADGTAFISPVTNWTDDGAGKTVHVGKFAGSAYSDLLMSWYEPGTPTGIQHHRVYKSNGSSFATGITDWTIDGAGAAVRIGNFDGVGGDDVLFQYTDNSQTSVVMQEPCWSNSQVFWGSNQVNRIENAKELIDVAGEWYLDRTGGYLYYKALPNENPAAEDIEAAPLDGPLVYGAQASNIALWHMTFEYAGWLEPNSNVGYADIQGGIHYNFQQVSEQTPGAVTFLNSKLISFAYNRILHDGGGGALFTPCQGCWIGYNVFQDISGTAIQLGNPTVSALSTPSLAQTLGNQISNNKISSTSGTGLGGAAVEYAGSVGIFVGYARDTLVTNNEVGNLPYTGISVGWGWRDYGTPVYAGHNTINANYVHDVAMSLIDGAGIYTLGTQVYSSSVSSVSGNHIVRVGNPDSANVGEPGWLTFAIYHDSATTGFSDSQNVIDRSKYMTLGQYAHAITVAGDFADCSTGFPYMDVPSSVPYNSVAITPPLIESPPCHSGIWASTAVSGIIAGAGPGF